MSALSLAACRVADEYGEVIPLGSRGVPLLKDAFTRGTRDPREIERTWREYPNAGVGVLAWTGRLLVIDVDTAEKQKDGHDGFAAMRALSETLGKLPRTRTHRSKSGGMHLVFRVPSQVGLRAAQGFFRGIQRRAPGVDIVTGRAALRWPPTTGYALHGDVSRVVDLPPAWLDALVEREQPPSSPVRLDTTQRIDRYIARAIELEAAELAQLTSGRNCALTRAAYKLGRFPHLSIEAITQALMAACEANGSLKAHGRRACLGTIRRSVTSGAKNPRDVRLAER